MSKISVLLKKVLLVLLIAGIGLSAMPITSVAASGLADEADPPRQQMETARITQAYARLVEWYNRQSSWMDQSDAIIARVQNLIDQATARGLDASAVQAALNAFAAAVPNAKVYNQQAGAIVASHPGFDDSGNVTDPRQAIETVRSLHQALKTAHDTMNGTGMALKEAIKAFIEANRPRE
ncbi:MAG: hypothetical protein ABIJ39_06840 [Chloroflexota bacterium]